MFISNGAVYKVSGLVLIVLSLMAESWNINSEYYLLALLIAYQDKNPNFIPRHQFVDRIQTKP